MERLVILAEPDRPISPSALSGRISFPPESGPAQGSLKQRLAQLERELILEALRVHDNNRSRAAEALQVSRQTIISKLKRYEAGR